MCKIGVSCTRPSTLVEQFVFEKDRGSLCVDQKLHFQRIFLLINFFPGSVKRGQTVLKRPFYSRTETIDKLNLLPSFFEEKLKIAIEVVKVFKQGIKHLRVQN